MNEIKTERLLLRQFRDSDLEPLIAMGQDPVVMKHFVAMMTPEETKAMFGRIKDGWLQHGYGAFAVEIAGEFAGFIGFSHPRWKASFTPCVEILWRLIPQYHNQGYCTEAAQAALEWVFKRTALKEIYSFAVPQNIPSWRVMEKIGMKREGEFEHPMVEEGHALRTHLIYKMSRP